MSFFVTLPSHSSIQEFPNNNASSFKVRLPEPLRLMGDNWQVGLSSLSLPDTELNLFTLANANEYIFGETCYIKLGSQRIQKTFNLPFITFNEHRWPVTDGVSFMKEMLKWVNKRFNEENWRSYGFYYLDNNKHTCLQWKWQGEDLYLDNSQVARHRYTQTGVQQYSPFVAFNKKVCLKMGWFVETSSGFELGANLLMSFPDGKVPAKNEADFVSPSFDPLYFTSHTDSNNTTWIFLSMWVNWTFINLNQAFRSVVRDPTRTLHIYSDVGSSTMVGNKVVDLLREVKYDRTSRGQVYFEPRHIQYIPVRLEVMDIIEVQVAETTGAGDDLAYFGPGHTLLTLHFKQE